MPEPPDFDIGGMRIVGATPEHGALLRARDRFVSQWCQEHGKDRASLSLAEVLEIRRDPRWKNPDA